MKKKTLFILMFYTSVFCYAQQQDNIIPLSPNAAALTQYVDYPVSHYTGVPNINIPLYEIRCDGITIPISLSYHASGIQVSQEASWVGLGWNLSTGGVISRSIKCGDDFFYESVYPLENGYYNGPEIAGNNIDPAWFGYNRLLYGINQNDFYTLNGGSCGSAGLRTDSEPDIFFLSLPGLSNKFILDKSRGAILFDKNKNVKIEVLGSRSHYDYYRFVVTTMDGAQYYFDQKEMTESKYSTLSFNENFTTNAKLDGGIGFPGTLTNYVSSWYLSKIITPNQREIIFTYTTEKITSPIQESCSKYLPFGYFTGVLGGDSMEYRYQTSKSTQSALRLAKIEWDGGSIEFVAKDRSDLNGTAKCLEKLIVRDRQNTFMKGFIFDYEYFNGDKKGVEWDYVYLRLKLKSVQEYSQTTALNSGYRFSYFEGAMPIKNSKNKDYWGYHNNSNYGSNYYSSVYKYAVLLDGAIKSSNLDYLRIGTLKEIKQPTGGITQFVYEENRYGGETPEPPKIGAETYINVFNKHIVTEFDNDNYPSSYSHSFTLSSSTNVTLHYIAESYSGIRDNDMGDNYAVGRIRKISGDPSTKYVYLPSSEFYGTYGGYRNTSITFQLPVGSYVFDACTPPKDVFVFWTLQNIAGYGQYERKGGGLRIAQIITDGKVRKFEYEGGGFLVKPILSCYDLRCGEASGDIWAGRSFSGIVQLSEPKLPLSTLSNGNSIGYSRVVESMESDGQVLKTEYLFHNHEESEMWEEVPFASPTFPNTLNGFPESINHYVGYDDVIVQENKFNYQQEQSPPIYGFIYSQILCHAYDYTYTIGWVKKTKETTIDYTYNAGEQSHIQETNYTYNTNFLLSTSSTTRSDGKVVTTKYTYPFEIKHGADMPIMSKMVEKFMLASPVEKVSYLNNGTIIDGEYHKYKEFPNGVLLPERKDILRLDALTTYSSLYPNGTTTMYGNSKLNPETYYKYNTKGNVLEVKSDSQLVTTYIWSYNYQYPVAKIENATYESVRMALDYGSDAEVEMLAGKDEPSPSEWGKINNLRTKLPDAMITTYTYKPLVGFQTVTSPGNKVTTYEYDSFGRLTSIKDHAGKIIEYYNYHYTRQ